MIEDLRQERLKKKQRLEEAGIDTYPASVKRTAPISKIQKDWDALLTKQNPLAVAGRIFAIRGQGGVCFIDIKDEDAGIQIVFRKDNSDDFHPANGGTFGLIRDALDIGDFIQAEGLPFVTKKGERSIDAKTVTMATKTLRPIPSEWYGISDQETRLRQRYLELIIKPETRGMFRQKTKFWNTFRTILIKNGFLEVETPVLELTTGGADAEPFATHHKALDLDMFLRISLELPLKKLLVGGFEKVFEIGRIFRNEGIDAEHLQDYTQLEFYWAYQDYKGLMKFIEKTYKQVIKATVGSMQTVRNGNTIDWSKKWETVDYFKIFKEQTGIDLNKATESELKAYAIKEKLDVAQHSGKGRLIDLIFKKIRHTLIQPCFLINPPVEVEPLAKRIKPGSNKVARFQIIAGGTELGKGFSELNDPVDQRGRFEEQMKLREAGDSEAQMMDEEFVEALEYGMPPAAGFGISERLFAILMDKPLRETVFFPTLRPKK